VYRLFIWSIGDSQGWGAWRTGEAGDKLYVKCILWESRRIIYSETKTKVWTGNADEVERIRRWAPGVDLISEDAT
jgi:hypothetical protein